MVRFIDDAGLLHIVPVGYHDDRMVINQDMVIYTKEGTVEGVTGGKPAHLTGGDENKVTSMDDITAAQKRRLHCALHFSPVICLTDHPPIHSC